MEQLTSKVGALTPDRAHAAETAQALLARTITRESLTIAFDDVFRLMAWLFALALVMVPFCKGQVRSSGSAGITEIH